MENKEYSTINFTDHFNLFTKFSNRRRFQFLRSNIEITIRDILYCPVLSNKDQDFFRNDWICFALRAYKSMKGHLNHKVDSFCSIGTGNGLDALGAIEAFGVKNITITDLDYKIAQMSKINILNNLQNRNLYKISPIESHLFKVGFNNKKFHLIYENLPILNSEYANNTKNPILSASFAERKKYGSIPHIYDNNLMFTHYEFLKEAKKHTLDNGVVLCNIGARISTKMVLQMFIDLGYKPYILVYDLKRQTEAESNLQAYAKYEKQNSIIFNFYKYDICQKIIKLSSYDKICGFAKNIEDDDLIYFLNSNKLTATEALEAYNNGNYVAHEVLTILGIPT